MNLKNQLFEAAKPFLMKEGLDSSKEMIANNAASFDEMGMANSNPGEFAPEEITDQENLVNVAKMSNDNDFNSDEGAEVTAAISVVGTVMPDAEDALTDIVNLGSDECPECHGEHGHHSLGDMIESILRKKDKALLESLDEAEMEEMATYYPGVIRDNKFQDETGKLHNGGPKKAARDLMSWLNKSGQQGSNLDDIIDGRHIVPDDVKAKWPEAIENYNHYSISDGGSPKYRDPLVALAKRMSGGDPAAAQALLDSPTPEFCQKASAILNNQLKNKLDLNFVPGQRMLFDKQARQRGEDNLPNAQLRQAFLNAYNSENPSKSNTVTRLEKWLNTPAVAPEVANPLGLSDEDVALLRSHNFQPDDPKAQMYLDLLKPEAPKKAPAKRATRSKAKESALSESEYAGNLAYNPDKRLNASDILKAVKNAVKPEFAAALSVVKNVDANEEPSYAIQNIDEKDLPATIEIDTNTDKKVVLKKDGNSYKFDK